MSDAAGSRRVGTSRLYRPTSGNWVVKGCGSGWGRSGLSAWGAWTQGDASWKSAPPTKKKQQKGTFRPEMEVAGEEYLVFSGFLSPPPEKKLKNQEGVWDSVAPPPIRSPCFAPSPSRVKTLPPARVEFMSGTGSSCGAGPLQSWTPPELDPSAGPLGSRTSWDLDPWSWTWSGAGPISWTSQELKPTALDPPEQDPPSQILSWLR